MRINKKGIKKLLTGTFILLAAFVLDPMEARASITLDHSVTGYVGSDTSVTASGIVPTGTNRLGIVKAGWFATGDVSSITWGGVDITANVIKNAAHDGSARKRMIWVYYLNPPTSSADVVVTKLSGVTAMSVIVEAWSGVDQTTPYGDLTATTDNAQETANPAVKTITATAGKTVTDAFFMWASGGAGTTWTLGGDQTEIQASLRNFGGGVNTGFFGSSYATSDGSVDMTWDTDHLATNAWAMYIISLTPAEDAVIVRPAVKIKGSIRVRGGMRIR